MNSVKISVYTHIRKSLLSKGGTRESQYKFHSNCPSYLMRLNILILSKLPLSTVVYIQVYLGPASQV